MAIPTLKEMLAYQAKNPKLSGVDVRYLYERYEATAKIVKGKKVWVDKNNQRVKNWKQKLWTLARYYPPKLCGICSAPTKKYQMREGKRFYICKKCSPEETPRNPNPVLPKKTVEQVQSDKVNKLVKGLAESLSAEKG